MPIGALSGDKDDVVNTVFVSGKKTIGTSEVLVAASASNQTDRQEIVIYNTSTNTIYVGPTGVTASGANEGLPIDPKETFTLTLGDGLELYAIAGSNSDVIIWELG